MTLLTQPGITPCVFFCPESGPKTKENDPEPPISDSSSETTMECLLFELSIYDKPNFGEIISL